MTQIKALEKLPRTEKSWLVSIRGSFFKPLLSDPLLIREIRVFRLAKPVSKNCLFHCSMIFKLCHEQKYSFDRATTVREIHPHRKGRW
jgi:hypothetical protein